MVNPKAGGAGEGNNNGDKGKGKMVSPSSLTSMEDIPDLHKYEVLAESLHKQMLDIKAWKEASEASKEGEKEEKEEESPEFPEWDDPFAVQLQELLILMLKDCFQTAIKKIATNGYSIEQAEWAVLASSFYMGSNDITSNIVAAAMALLANRKEFDPSERYIFETVESLAEYALVEMVNVLKNLKPYLTVAEAMWLLLLCDLNLLQANAYEREPKGPSSSTMDIFLQKGIPAKTKNNRGETVYAVPVKITTAPEIAKPGTKAARKAPKNLPYSPRKTSFKARRNFPALPQNVAETMAEKKADETPKTEKDEVIEALKQRKKDLEKELKGWSDWTTVKIREAAQKLSRDQAEKKMLKQEIDKSRNSPNEKKLSELDVAIYNAEALKEMANAKLIRLQIERTMLLKELEDSKLFSANTIENLQETKLREQDLLKQCGKLEKEITFAQEDLAALKGEGAKLQQQIEKARKRENEFEVLRQHEEREKIKLLQKAESLRNERRQMMQQAKMEEENLKAKAEEARLKYEELMKKMSAQISALKLGGNSGQGGIKREWECVMCLSLEKTVVFLPCAHLTLCKDCNVLHERQGMKECPICRTPIVQRITVRFPPPPRKP